MWFRGVDISSPAVKKSGLSAAAYYQQHVADLIESSGEDALIVLDDFPDGAPGLYPMLLAAYNNWIRVARQGATPARACRATSTSSSFHGRSRAVV